MLLERVFDHSRNELSKLGFGAVRRSTLSDANKNRPVAIFEDIFQHCLKLYSSAPKAKPSLDLGFPVYLMDSTFIELCLSLCPWADYSRSRPDKTHDYGGIKIHTAIDLAGHIPEFVVVKEGRESINNDLRVARENIKLPKGSLVVFDRGYFGLKYLNELNEQEVNFVTRPKFKKMKFRVAKSRPVDKAIGLRCDQTIYFNSRHTKGLYKGALRRVSYFDPDTNKRFTFISNRFDISAKAICDLYKARWQVELFFRTLKQNLKVKKFLGLNRNAVRAQIYAALICYVLLKYLKQLARSTISMPEMMAVIATLLLQKFNIIELLSDRPRTRRHPPPVSSQLELWLVT